ncbi:MAG: PEP-CTERM sorting domain-containing protein [Planctomycetota bacterium]
MRLSTISSLAAIFAIAALATPASAAIIYDAGFNMLGDTQGWAERDPAPAAAVINGLAADGNTLNGTAAGNDPQLINDNLNVSKTPGFDWDSIVFRVREVQNEAPGGVVGFSPTGMVVQIDFGNPPVTTISSGFTAVASGSGNGFLTISVPIPSSFTNPTIVSLRIDPIGGAGAVTNSDTNGNTFEVDYIRITDTSPVPEPVSTALVGLVLASGWVMRRRLA